MSPRLKEKYESTIKAEIMEQFKCANVNMAPKLVKIVVNIGVGDSQTDARLLDAAVSELTAITGQKACIRKARRSISNFKLREGTDIGCMVTLRGDRMYEFMDRLLNVAIPRVRDFRGLSSRAFDGQGNYTMGIREQGIFPEIDPDKIVRERGMNITFVIKNSRSADESRELLRKFGMAFSSN